MAYAEGRPIANLWQGDAKMVRSTYWDDYYITY